MINMTDKLPFERISPKILTKQSPPNAAGLTFPPDQRPIDRRLDFAVVNLDKPPGITSRDAADAVNRILGTKKSGHSGTLDPAVTGVLPIGIGRATRVITTTLSAGKEYIANMQLHSDIDENTIRSVFADFTTTITQTPPVRSRVKRRPRKRTIYYLEILRIHNRQITFCVGCQAGTYIRKLAHDMGLAMTTTAHMTELRRTKAGPFTEHTLTTLDDLQTAFDKFKHDSDDTHLGKLLLPAEFAVSHIPHIWADDGAIKPLCYGCDLAAPGVIKLHDTVQPHRSVAIMTSKDELLALGIARMSADQIINAEKGIAATTDKVLHSPPP